MGVVLAPVPVAAADCYRSRRALLATAHRDVHLRIRVGGLSTKHLYACRQSHGVVDDSDMQTRDLSDEALISSPIFGKGRHLVQAAS